MRPLWRCVSAALCALALLVAPSSAAAQTSVDSPAGAATAHQHERMQMNMPMNDGWTFMRDGIVFVDINHQGGPRGGNELVVPNWWMGMASRETSRGRVTL